MPTNRTVTLTGIFAESATTTIPASPVAGVSYRNSAMTSTAIQNGWPFKTVVDSSNFNQAMYELSSIAKQFEQYGFLPWSNLTDYPAGGFALGSNGTLYQALQATGPSTTALDPTTDTNMTYWKPVQFGADTGMVSPYAGSTPPAGWLICDGSAISRTTYSALFAVIGTTYGTGDGSTTFNLPNLQDRVPQGAGTRGAVGTTLNESLPNIKATFATPYTRDASPSDYFSGCVTQGEAIKIAVTAGPGKNFKSVLNASVSSSAYQDNAPVQQDALCLNYCIKY